MRLPDAGINSAANSCKLLKHPRYPMTGGGFSGVSATDCRRLQDNTYRLLQGCVRPIHGTDPLAGPVGRPESPYQHGLPPLVPSPVLKALAVYKKSRRGAEAPLP
jgi:hypothetical protein